MLRLLSANDLLEYAMQIEVDGAAKYELAAGITPEAGAAELFRNLARDERAHAETFAGMVRRGQASLLDRPYGQAMREYIEALVSSQVMPGPAEIAAAARAGEPGAAAFDLALAMEHNAVLLYQELRNLVGEEDQATIEALIVEEEKHVHLLTERRMAAQRAA